MLKPRAESSEAGLWITLSEWAREVGVTLQNAKDMARRGRLGDSCIKGKVEYERFIVKKGTPYPRPLKKEEKEAS